MGEQDQLARQQRGVLQGAGQMAASGQLAGAQKHLLAQGMFEEAKGIEGMMQRASDQQLAKAQRTYKVLGGLAMAADTPEKWQAAVAAAGKAGMDVSKYGDFGARDLVMAQSGMIGDYLDNQLKSRALAIKAAKSTGAALPAEMGARIGMGDQFLKELPDIKKRVDKMGAADRANLALGRGEAAEIWRRIETGREALVRNLTGAGMAQAEAENAAARYQISSTDQIGTMQSKLEGLKRDLEAVRSGAIQGKGGTMSATPPTGEQPEAEQPPAGDISGMSDDDLLRSLGL